MESHHLSRQAQHQWLLFLQAHGGGASNHKHRETHVISLLVISDIHASATDSVFKTEPALSFVVDNKVTEQEVSAIGAALNQGAFVFIPSQESEHCMGDIRNKRFRISYLLCPRYRLPLMYGQPVILSNILRSQGVVGGDQFTLSDLYR
jgi:hypothetical protein